MNEKTGKSAPLIERHLLSAKAAEVLRDKIIKGEFPQGQKLIEEELSGMLGVSRACIREAVMQLENEGLIVRTQYGEYALLQKGIQSVQSVQT